MVCPRSFADVTSAMLGVDGDVGGGISPTSVRAGVIRALVTAIRRARSRGLAPGVSGDEYIEAVDNAEIASGSVALRLLGWRLG